MSKPFVWRSEGDPAGTTVIVKAALKLSQEIAKVGWNCWSSAAQRHCAKRSQPNVVQDDLPLKMVDVGG
jgi:hypothetical protein